MARLSFRPFAVMALALTSVLPIAGADAASVRSFDTIIPRGASFDTIIPRGASFDTIIPRGQSFDTIIPRSVR